jgi:hypothetical protein
MIPPQTRTLSLGSIDQRAADISQLVESVSSSEAGELISEPRGGQIASTTATRSAKKSFPGNTVASSSKPVLQLLETAVSTLESPSTFFPLSSPALTVIFTTEGKERHTINVEPWSGSDLSSLPPSPTDNMNAHIPSAIFKQKSLTFQEPAKSTKKLELQVGSGSGREWSFDGLGVYVWVLLDAKSWKVVEDQDAADETIWWPGLVCSA